MALFVHGLVLNMDHPAINMIGQYLIEYSVAPSLDICKIKVADNSGVSSGRTVPNQGSHSSQSVCNELTNQADLYRIRRSQYEILSIRGDPCLAGQKKRISPK